jgi:hypothetical protein
MKTARIICWPRDSTLRPTSERGFDIIPAQPELILSVSCLMKLRHFLTFLATENLSSQGKEVDDLKMPETIVNIRFMPFRGKSLSLSRF